MGIKVGGEIGSKLLTKLYMPASGDTLLRLVCKADLPKHEAPRVVGVDDWSLGTNNYQKGYWLDTTYRGRVRN